jgi:S-adenosylmethionine-dependent carboxyl methyltransferase
MSNEHLPSHGVMEGKGAYNKYAKLPAGGASLALPLLEKAVRDVELDSGDQPVIIADYGSSQGKNSMVPVQVAIRGLRHRLGPNRAISVFHIDQPSNDFNTLFEILDADPDRYVVDEPNVFPAAIGRSFYENVLPPSSVHLAWSSYAAVWLSRVPRLIPGHFVALFGAGSVRAEFERQGAQDWEAFLSLRSKELRPGGRLVVVLPALDDNGLSGFEHIFQQANAVLGDMVDEGAITSEERSRMVLGAYPRRKRDLLAPFASNGKFQQLTVDDFEMSELSDAAWTDYERDGDKATLSTKHALFFRSVFVPSLASALDSVRPGDAEALGTFGDRLEEHLKRRLANQPAPMHSFVQAMVLAEKD